MTRRADFGDCTGAATSLPQVDLPPATGQLVGYLRVSTRSPNPRHATRRPAGPGGGPDLRRQDVRRPGRAHRVPGPLLDYVRPSRVNCSLGKGGGLLASSAAGTGAGLADVTARADPGRRCPPWCPRRARPPGRCSPPRITSVRAGHRWSRPVELAGGQARRSRCESGPRVTSSCRPASWQVA